MEPPDIEARVAQSITTCPHNGHLLVAVSGGADSTALLYASSRVREMCRVELFCLHVDHGIRAQEERQSDLDWVRTLCADCNVSLRVVSIPPGQILAEAKSTGKGIEAVAREYRTRAWTEEARRTGASHILVAHNADDRLEQVLLRFLRGSGPRGLALLPSLRASILRPLITTSRREILAYLEASGLGYKTDSTNADPAYFRNRLRLKLIPYLDRHFPAWRGAVLSLAGTQSKVADFLVDEASRRLRWSGENGELMVRESDFFAEDRVIREEAVFLAIDCLLEKKADLPLPRALQADPRREGRAEPRRAVIARFSEASSGPASADCGRVCLLRRDGWITVRLKTEVRGQTGFFLLLRSPGRFELGERAFQIAPVRELAVGEIAVGLFLPAALRSVSAGDKLERGGRHSAVKKLLAGEAGLSRVVEDRDGIAAVLLETPGKPLRVWTRDTNLNEASMRSGQSFLYYLIWGNDLERPKQ